MQLPQELCTGLKLYMGCGIPLATMAIPFATENCIVRIQFSVVASQVCVCVCECKGVDPSVLHADINKHVQSQAISSAGNSSIPLLHATVSRLMCQSQVKLTACIGLLSL